MDEGFARNIQQILGVGELFHGLDQAPLKSVTLSEDKETLTFLFENGEKIEYGVEGDCCSSSWIEHLEGAEGVEGQTLEKVGDACYQRDDETEENYNVRQYYKTTFVTDKGQTITLEYRNDSNGYYGGYLVRKGRA